MHGRRGRDPAVLERRRRRRWRHPTRRRLGNSLEWKEKKKNRKTGHYDVVFITRARTGWARLGATGAVSPIVDLWQPCAMDASGHRATPSSTLMTAGSRGSPPTPSLRSRFFGSTGALAPIAYATSGQIEFDRGGRAQPAVALWARLFMARVARMAGGASAHGARR